MTETEALARLATYDRPRSPKYSVFPEEQHLRYERVLVKFLRANGFGALADHYEHHGGTVWWYGLRTSDQGYGEFRGGAA